jgi:hypothetical protein
MPARCTSDPAALSAALRAPACTLGPAPAPRQVQASLQDHVLDFVRDVTAQKPSLTQVGPPRPTPPSTRVAAERVARRGGRWCSTSSGRGWPR